MKKGKKMARTNAEKRTDRAETDNCDCANGEVQYFYLKTSGLIANVSDDGKTVAFQTAGGCPVRLVSSLFAEPFICDAAAVYGLTPLENGVYLVTVAPAYPPADTESPIAP